MGVPQKKGPLTTEGATLEPVSLLYTLGLLVKQLFL